MLRKRNKIIFVFACLAVALIVFLIPQSTYAAIIEPLYKVLATQDQIKDVWSKVLIFVNSLGAAVLIFIAFANILRININNYGIKKFLPTLILTIIAANFSYLICRMLVDLANVASDLLILGPGGKNIVPDIAKSYGAFNFTAPEFNENINTDNYWTYLVFAIGEAIGAVMILILAFLFFIRNYIIYFLVVLAPIAFVSLSLPQTKTAFNQWWSYFWKWTFLPIISLFWLWLAAQWVGSSFLPRATTLMGFAFAAVCYYLAITTPFKMGGSIMQQWGNLGKKAWGSTGGKATAWAGKEAKERAGDAALRARLRVANTRPYQAILGDRSYIGLRRAAARQNAATRRLRLESPGLVAAKNAEDAKVVAAERIAANPTTSPAVRRRMNSIMRTWNQGEQLSLRDARASDVLAELNNNDLSYIDLTTGQRLLYSGRQLHNMGRSYIANDGYGRLKVLENKLKNIARSARDPQERRIAEYALTGAVTNAPAGWAAPAGIAPLDYSNYGTPAQPYSPFGPTSDPSGFTPNNFAASPVGQVAGDAQTNIASAIAQNPGIAREASEQMASRAINDALHDRLIFDGASTIVINGQRVHLNTQGERAIGDLSNYRKSLVAEEFTPRKEAIDGEMAGAKIVHDQIMKTTSEANQNARLGTMDLSAAEGLSSLQRGEITSAITAAQKFGQTGLSADDPEIKNRLNNLFSQIESGVKDVQGLRGTSGTIPREWSGIETQLRSAKEALAQQQAETVASARIIAEQHPIPAQTFQNLGDSSVADAVNNQTERLADLTSHVEGLAHQTAEARQLATITPINPKTAIMGAMTGAGLPGDTMFADIANDADRMRKFNQELAVQVGKQVGLEVTKANRNVPPRVDGVGPRGPQVTNVTNVTNATSTPGASATPAATAAPPVVPPTPPAAPSTPPPANPGTR